MSAEHDHNEAIERLLALSGVPFKKKDKKKDEEDPKEEAAETPAEESHEPEEGDERDDAAARPGSVEESFMGKKDKKK